MDIITPARLAFGSGVLFGAFMGMAIYALIISHRVWREHRLLELLYNLYNHLGTGDIWRARAMIADELHIELPHMFGREEGR